MQEECHTAGQYEEDKLTNPIKKNIRPGNAVNGS